MIETKSHNYAWSKAWIDFQAPNATGVYWLRDKEGKTLFVGKGNVRERLLSHWNRENSTDLAIWDHSPATFRFELTRHPAERQAEHNPAARTPNSRLDGGRAACHRNVAPYVGYNPAGGAKMRQMGFWHNF